MDNNFNSVLDDDEPLPFAAESQRAKTTDNAFTSLYDNWKQNDTPQTRGALLKQTAPIINTAVQTYAPNSGQALKSRAKLMAMEAIRSYDPNRGNIKNHMLSHMRRLSRIAGQQQQIISVPERIIMDRKHLKEAEEDLRDRIGRDPSDSEIADHTGLSLKRINYIRTAGIPINTGSILGEDGEVFSPASTLPGQDNNYDLWTELVYHDSDNISKAIMDYTLGLHGSPKLSNADIARRLGVTPGAVSQRKAKIQAAMDEQYTSQLFGE